jgi:hypothetical protein
VQHGGNRVRENTMEFLRACLKMPQLVVGVRIGALNKVRNGVKNSLT